MIYTNYLTGTNWTMLFGATKLIYTNGTLSLSNTVQNAAMGPGYIAMTNATKVFFYDSSTGIMHVGTTTIDQNGLVVNTANGVDIGDANTKLDIGTGFSGWNGAKVGWKFYLLLLGWKWNAFKRSE